MDRNQLLGQQVSLIQFNEQHKAMIAAALQEVANEITTQTKLQEMPTVDAIKMPSYSYDDDDSKTVHQAFGTSNVNAATSYNKAASRSISGNSSTNLPHFTIKSHLFAEAHTVASFVTLTDITQDTLQVQQIHLDCLRTAETPTVSMEIKEERLDVAENEQTEFNIHDDLRRADTPSVPVEIKDELLDIAENQLTEANINESLHENADEPMDVKVEEFIVDIDPDFDDNYDDNDEQDTFSNTDDDESLLRARPSKNNRFISRKLNISVEALILYICPECNHKCDDYEDWKQHTDDLHQFNTFEKLNVRTVFNQKGQVSYQCRQCPAKFNQTSNGYDALISHHIKHSKLRKPIECRVCDQRFSRRKIVKQHLRTTHPHMCKIQPPTRDKTHPVMQHLRIFCPTCNEPQQTRQQWIEHLRIKHDFFAKSKQHIKHISSCDYACIKCDKRMILKSVTNHMLLHEPHMSFQCTICVNFKTVTQGRAMDHVRYVHLDKMNNTIYKCNFCNEIFRSRMILTRHKRRDHKKHCIICKVCQRNFSTLSALLTHLDSVKHHKEKQ